MESLLELPATKDLNLASEKITTVEPAIDKSDKARICKWIPSLTSTNNHLPPGMKENEVAESPQSKIEQIKALKGRPLNYPVARFKEPLGVSQRLNISG